MPSHHRTGMPSLRTHEAQSCPRLAPCRRFASNSVRFEQARERVARSKQRASTAASRGPKTRRRSQPARAPCPEPSAAATSAALWPSVSFLGPHHPPYARAPKYTRTRISSNHCKALRALRPCSCRLNGIQPVSRHREPGTARGRKGMKTQPGGRLPQIGAVSTHARMQTARDCTFAPHTHQVS